MESTYNENSTQFEDDTQQGRYLTFTIGSVSYGIEMQYIREIVGLQDITSTPDMPDHYKGIINLRGKIIPVMDVRRRFLMQENDYNDRTCIIVIDLLDSYIGLIVDSVSEVLTIAKEDISESPALSSKNSKYVQSIGKVDDSVILLLECESLVIDSIVTTLNEIA